MSRNNSTDAEESDELWIAEDEDVVEVEEGDEGEFGELSQADLDHDLFTAVKRNDSAGVRRALRNGANVNCCSGAFFATPLMNACAQGYDEIVRILLEAGADARSAIHQACARGHLSTVEILVNHDESLLDIRADIGSTPLVVAIISRKFGIVHRFLDRGANVFEITKNGLTTLMLACQGSADLRLVRRLLAAGVSVEARNDAQRTALHYAAKRGSIEIVRELIVKHNANMVARDINDKTPFDLATHFDSAGLKLALLIERYSDKLTQEHGRLALHAILGAADCSFAEARGFHPPQNPLRIRLPLGTLSLQHFHTLVSTLDVEQIRNRGEIGKLPIHMACQANAPVEVLSMLVEMDPTTLQIADYSGSLPIHSLCGSSSPTEYASVRYLMEQGGVGTLATRNRNGALPLHVLCGSSNPSLRTVQYLVQSFPTSVTVQTNAGHYPFMIAACSSSTASLSVVYALVRANPSVWRLPTT